jgi:N-acetylglucosamine-6-phosphate deacetylase
VPNQKVRVKGKPRFISAGVVDLHFHGAFGIDLMQAEGHELDALSQALWQNGVAGFVATTLSVPQPELLGACERLGSWIRSETAPGAQPLGLHLEGPFISPAAAGAHPPGSIRPLSLSEVETLWETSQRTLKILTVAPETLDNPTLKALARFCKKNQIVLSAGHSKATKLQAERAFDAGFSGVTHGWNAMSFHQREPGLLGAALGRKDTYVELIIDQAHVEKTVLRWTHALHPNGCCYVSDCVPAARTEEGTWHTFGSSLQIQFDGHVCRLPNDALAGGGLLLGESYARWLKDECEETGEAWKSLWERTVQNLTTRPLQALGLRKGLLDAFQVEWAPGKAPKPVPVTRQLTRRGQKV